MHRFITPAAAVLPSIALAACAITAAPHADDVRLTRVPADVASCKAVGNIDERQTQGLEALLRNHAVGLGADTVLLTAPLNMAGVAYRCARE